MEDVRDQMTERLLSDAGIGVGMRVLDVGCGRGDVSFMIGRRVGEHGYVLGVDRDSIPLVSASECGNLVSLISHSPRGIFPRSRPNTAYLMPSSADGYSCINQTLSIPCGS